jgi:hypothetical protein
MGRERTPQVSPVKLSLQAALFFVGLYVLAFVVLARASLGLPMWL